MINRTKLTSTGLFEQLKKFSIWEYDGILRGYCVHFGSITERTITPHRVILRNSTGDTLEIWKEKK